MAGFSITIRAGAVRQMLMRGEKQAAIVLAQQITKEAMMVLRESQRRVPLLTGVLRASGKVTPARVIGNTRVQAAKITYGGAASAYAWYQHREHEPPFRYSKAGTGPLYLSNPMKERMPILQASVGSRISMLLKVG